MTSVNREIYDTWLGSRGTGPQFIPRLHITKEYSFIFLGTDEYRGIYSSISSSVMKICSSVIVGADMDETHTCTHSS
jgi:hypothetical protein